ncbi:MAG: phage tail tape measure protein [Methanocellales archaeon]|nr:phage tail tape measure protein [Methanocellales archaeon]
MKSVEANVKTAMEKVQGHLKAVGAAFTATGAAGMNFVSDAKSLNAQLGQTGLTIGASTKEMRDLALATTNVTFPLKSVASTFEILARAGVKSKDEMQAVANAFDGLADATGSSAEVVADQLVPAYKLFGLELPKTTSELDKFTWLTKNTTVDISDFASVMTYVAKEGDGLNITLDEMVAMMAALEAKGVSGATATMKMRMAVTEAAKGEKTLAEALDLTSEEVALQTARMSEATGVTDEYAAIANSQFTILDKLKQKFSEITLVVGSYLTPLEGVLAAMTALGPVMLFLSTSAGMATVKFVAHTAATIAHTAATIATTVATGALTAAQWALNVAMDANPIGLVILAIGALIAIIITLTGSWGELKDKMLGVWEAISSTLTKTWGALLDFFQNFWNSLYGFFVEGWGKILLGPIGLILFAVDQIRDKWDSILSFFSTMWGGIKSVFSTAWNWINSYVIKPFTTALNELMDLYNSTIGKVAGVVGKGIDIGSSVVDKLTPWASGGTITEPTLLYGLRSMKPYAVAGEAGIEHVVPANQMGSQSVTALIQGNNFYVREEADIDKIGQAIADQIRLRTGMRL